MGEESSETGDDFADDFKVDKGNTCLLRYISRHDSDLGIILLNRLDDSEDEEDDEDEEEDEDEDEEEDEDEDEDEETTSDENYDKHSSNRRGVDDDESVISSKSDMKSSPYYKRYYGGVVNKKTIKDCSYLGGEACEYVMSGSDTGQIFIWDRETAELLRVISNADSDCVNVVQGNPVDEFFIASSGIDSDIKLWAPGGAG